MKLLFQADDFGLTEGIALGVEKCVKSGLVRNTGLFVNMPATGMAVDLISGYPDVCLGIDINLTAGRPVSAPGRVTHLLDRNNCFLSSKQVIENGKVIKREGLLTHFEQEPYPYEETYQEIEAQLLRFKTLVGRWPAYLHPHSLMTPATDKIMRKLAGVYGVTYTPDLWTQQGVKQLEMPWTVQPGFTWEIQLATDVEKAVSSNLRALPEESTVLLICHPGYVDASLFQYSSFTGIRMRDMEMASSKALMEFIRQSGIEQITYLDF